MTRLPPPLLSLLLVLAGACGPSRPRPARPPAPTAFQHVVFGGHDESSAQLVDLTTSRDGRVVMLACVATKTRTGLTILRWDPSGRLEARLDLAASRSCGRGRLVTTSSNETIVAEEADCIGASAAAAPDGCVILHRFDAALAGEVWSARPQFSHLMELAITAGDTLVAAGWRSRPGGVQDPTHTDVVRFGTDGARLRAIEITGRRVDISSLAFVGDDVLVLGLADRGGLVIDGTPVATAAQSMFLARVGATRWTYVLADQTFTSYLPPRLATPLGASAVVVGTGNDVRFAVRIDLATGQLLTRANARVDFDAGPTGAIVLPDGSVAIAQRVTHPISEQGPLCRGSRPCRYVGGPEAYGETRLPSVIRLDAKTLEPIAKTALTGHASVTEPRLVYAAATRSLLVGGSLEGSAELAGGTATTDAHAAEPCSDHDDSRRRSRSRDLFALEPPEPECLIRVSYTSAVFASRVAL